MPTTLWASATGSLGELLYLSENLVRIGQLAARVTFDVAYAPLLVDDERRPHVGVPVGPVHAVVLGGRAVDVREQRVVRDTDRLGPILVAEGAVRADTQHLGIGRLEIPHTLVEGGHARRSARRPVEWAEQGN